MSVKLHQVYFIWAKNSQDVGGWQWLPSEQVMVVEMAARIDAVHPNWVAFLRFSTFLAGKLNFRLGGGACRKIQKVKVKV